MELFAERLERLLKQNKITQTALADRVGIRRPTISDWKKNGSYPTADIAVKIAAALNTSVEFLVTGNDKNPLAEENKELKERLASIKEMASL